MYLLSSVLLGYLAGSVPFAFIVAKLYANVDIRTVGSKNPGATNVYRSVGKIPGIITLLLDAAKGVAPVLLVGELFGPNYSPITALSCILGHTYTIFLRFKGGKGIATAAGSFLALSPYPLIIAFAAFVLVYALTKYVSASSIAASVILAIFTFIIPNPALLRIIAVMATVLVVYRHMENIKRLIENREAKTKL